ncbi:MAG: NAD(+) synthase [Spirochaetales bacterium]|nr:NAD(+) synthase [Spirochaetales bacterium]
MKTEFGFERLLLDEKKAIENITKTLREYVKTELKRQGLVVALSGGIDSSVVGALAVKALGPDRILGLLLPERESSPDTLRLGKLVADYLGIETIRKDITGTLESAGCYRKRDEAIKEVIPEYTKEYKAKLVLPGIVETGNLRLFSIVVQAPSGRIIKKRLTSKAYLGIVAASNFKQRVRKMFEYYHADRLNYAVAGTPNRLEYDQGFFVKLGDGAADIKPVAHLYKTQVYQLAAFLGIPEEIRSRPPTTDTYSMPQSQEEFYFSLPYDKMDLCLYGKNNGIPAINVAKTIGLSEEQVNRVYSDIEQKRKTTRYLHLPPLLIENIEIIKP